MGEIACNDNTKEFFVAKSIVHQINDDRLRNTDIAYLFLKKLYDRSCRVVRKSLVARDLEDLRMKASSKFSPIVYSKENDPGKYQCEGSSAVTNDIVVAK